MVQPKRFDFGVWAQHREMVRTLCTVDTRSQILANCAMSNHWLSHVCFSQAHSTECFVPLFFLIQFICLSEALSFLYCFQLDVEASFLFSSHFVVSPLYFRLAVQRAPFRTLSLWLMPLIVSILFPFFTVAISVPLCLL